MTESVAPGEVPGGENNQAEEVQTSERPVLFRAVRRVGGGIRERRRQEREVHDQNFREAREKVVEKMENNQGGGFGVFWEEQIGIALEDNPEKLGNIGRTYRDAQEAVDKINEIKDSDDFEAKLGEVSSYTIQLQKAHTSLHKQLGLEGEYQVNVELDPDWDPQNDRRKIAKAVIDQVLENHEQFSAQIARKELDSMIDLRAEVELQKDELLAKHEEGNFSRSEFRAASYEMERKHKRWSRRNKARLREIGREGSVWQFDTLVEQEQEVNQAENLISLEEEEVSKVFYEKLGGDREDFEDVLGASGKGALKGKFYSSKKEEEQSKLNLKKLIEHCASADDICGEVNDVREERLQQEVIVAEAKQASVGGRTGLWLKRRSEEIDRLRGTGREVLEAYSIVKDDIVEFNRAIEWGKGVFHRIDNWGRTAWERKSAWWEKRKSEIARGLKEHVNTGFRIALREKLIRYKLLASFGKESALAVVGDIREIDVDDVRKNFKENIAQYRDQREKRLKDEEIDRELVIVSDLIGTSEDSEKIDGYGKELRDHNNEINQKLSKSEEEGDVVDDLLLAYDESTSFVKRKSLLKRIVRELQRKQEKVKEGTKMWPEMIVVMPIVSGIWEHTRDQKNLLSDCWEIESGKSAEEYEQAVQDIKERHKVNPHFKKYVDDLEDMAVVETQGVPEKEREGEEEISFTSTRRDEEGRETGAAAETPPSPDDEPPGDIVEVDKIPPTSTELDSGAPAAEETSTQESTESPPPQETPEEVELIFEITDEQIKDIKEEVEEMSPEQVLAIANGIAEMFDREGKFDDVRREVKQELEIDWMSDVQKIQRLIKILEKADLHLDKKLDELGSLSDDLMANRGSLRAVLNQHRDDYENLLQNRDVSELPDLRYSVAVFARWIVEEQELLEKAQEVQSQ